MAELELKKLLGEIQALKKEIKALKKSFNVHTHNIPSENCYCRNKPPSSGKKCTTTTPTIS